MMPLLTPIGDVCGLSRQMVVFAYSMGDSLTNTMTPMSGPMVGALELADVDYTAWLKYAVPLMGILAVIRDYLHNRVGQQVVGLGTIDSISFQAAGQ